LHVATDYGGTYGDQPWHGAQPPHPDQPRPDQPHPDQPPGTDEPIGTDEPPGADQPADEFRPPGWQRRSKTSFIIAVTALVLGVIGLAVSGIGVATQLLPRQFTATQQRQITNWEYSKHWRDLSAGEVFPATATYTPPSVLDDDPALALAARRIGLVKQATCRAAADAAAAAVLDRDGCTHMLRATYADATDSYVVTVGVAVLPGVAQAHAAAQSLTTARVVDGIAPGVRAVPFSHTAAQWFTNQRRQLSGSISAGTYVVLYTAGYADSRPKEPVSGDSYAEAEMRDAAKGVAQSVLAVLAAHVPSASCPGAPGC
jgi:hypothetical protein